MRSRWLRSMGRSPSHAAVNASFCDDFLWFANRDGQPALGKRTASIIDFGTGTALIPIALCGRAAGFTVIAIDLAENMLALAHVNVARAKLGDRVLLERVDAKGTPYEDGAFGATISNSIVHHIPVPQRCLTEMWRVTAPRDIRFERLRLRGQVFRPEDEMNLSEQEGDSLPPDATRITAFPNRSPGPETRRMTEAVSPRLMCRTPVPWESSTPSAPSPPWWSARFRNWSSRSRRYTKRSSSTPSLSNTASRCWRMDG